MVRVTKSKVSRVLLADEHPLVRVPLAAVINAEPDFAVCGQACNRTEALAVARAKSPDLALVGLKLHGSHGLDLIKDLRSQQPDVAVIVLTPFDDDHWVERSLRAGARGFVSKKQQPAELLAAMRQVLAGEYFVHGSVVRRLAKTRTGTGGSTARLDDLPDREYQVLWYIGHGYTSREIAEHLRVSVPTVETYRSRLKDKLGGGNHTDLLKCAIQWAHSNPAA
jgi:DNA-binding NarL/FixJ family response regulator